jgi:hypothetical protein
MTLSRMNLIPRSMAEGCEITVVERANTDPPPMLVCGGTTLDAAAPRQRCPLSGLRAGGRRISTHGASRRLIRPYRPRPAVRLARLPVASKAQRDDHSPNDAGYDRRDNQQPTRASGPVCRHPLTSRQRATDVR